MSGETCAPLRYARYMGAQSETVYSYEEFCGACLQHLGSALLAKRYRPDDLMAENETMFGLRAFGRSFDDQAEYCYWQFCPWCGVALGEQWQRNQPLQNERAIDHYRDPGTHAGDTHEFAGDGPDCMTGHMLASSGSEPCWCKPDIEPGLMGCTIRHHVR